MKEGLRLWSGAVEKPHRPPGAFVTHANALLTPESTSALGAMRCRLGMVTAPGPDRSGVSVTCAHRWATCCRQYGPACMAGPLLPAALISAPHRAARRVERQMFGYGSRSRRWGPAQTVYHLGLNISTPWVLARYHCPRLT